MIFVPHNFEIADITITDNTTEMHEMTFLNLKCALHCIYCLILHKIA